MLALSSLTPCGVTLPLMKRFLPSQQLGDGSISKTKEVVMDFFKSRSGHLALAINGQHGNSTCGTLQILGCSQHSDNNTVLKKELNHVGLTL